MSGERKDIESRKPKHRRLVIALVVLIAVFLPGYLFFKYYVVPMGHVFGCQQNLSYFHQELRRYPKVYDGKYPAPERWCDLVLESYITGSIWHGTYRCWANRNHRCSYAMNPDCEPNSSDDMVLLFETEDGWNQFGGPELLTFENHGGKGCNVLFNDGHIEFIKPSQVSKLKWDVRNDELWVKLLTDTGSAM